MVNGRGEGDVFSGRFRAGSCRLRPGVQKVLGWETGRMEDVLGYARVLTGEQDRGGQRLRLQRTGVIRVFEDVRDRSMGRDGLDAHRLAQLSCVGIRRSA
jgi:hypothetical protein